MLIINKMRIFITYILVGFAVAACSSNVNDSPKLSSSGIEEEKAPDWYNDPKSVVKDGSDAALGCVTKTGNDNADQQRAAASARAKLIEGMVSTVSSKAKEVTGAVAKSGGTNSTEQIDQSTQFGIAIKQVAEATISAPVVFSRNIKDSGVQKKCVIVALDSSGIEKAKKEMAAAARRQDFFTKQQREEIAQEILKTEEFIKD
ncbi:MAG: hypothetical protein QM538_05705 [Methylacidiphilales bacterium]|nr:hypothetical protein [Candidatus Methylacidiphilales bacterium]